MEEGTPKVLSYRVIEGFWDMGSEIDGPAPPPAYRGEVWLHTHGVPMCSANCRIKGFAPRWLAPVMVLVLCSMPNILCSLLSECSQN